jgi:hypothetical protein
MGACLVMSQAELSNPLAFSCFRLYGRDMDKPRTLTFQPEEGIREALEQVALERDRSLAWIVNYYLRKGLQDDKKIPSEPKRK